ncbi:MAG: CBS domain-containing protein, partial [Pseudomonadota bacterium]
MTQIEHVDDQDGYELDESLVPAVRLALASGNQSRLDALFEPLHAADIADLLEQLDHGQRRELIVLTPRTVDGDVLSELDESIREDIIDFLPEKVLTEAVRDLDSDDVVDLLEDLGEPQQEAILEVLEDADRVAVEQSLSFPEESAGRLMQREVVMGPEHWTVGQAIDFLRSSENLPEQFYHMILVDPRMRPTGYVTLGRLLGARREVKMKDIIEDSFRTIPADQDEAEVAYAFNQYHLISAPVVDENERLVGVITIDDA